MMEETGAPNEHHRPTGNFLICPGRDTNPGSDDRQLAVSGNAFDHTATGVGPVIRGAAE